LKHRKQLKPLGKRSVSTWPHAATLREFLIDCEQRGQTVSERLRQILDEYYTNERLKSIGRDTVEAPVRRIQKEAISEELAPFRQKVAEIELNVGATRSMVEEVLGQIAQIGLHINGASPDLTGEHVLRLESVVNRLISLTTQLHNGDSAVPSNAQDHAALNAEVIKELNSLKAVMAKVAIRSLKATVLSAARAELKSGHDLHVEWHPQTGLQIFVILRVVEKVADPELEIALAEAQQRWGPDLKLGDKVRLRPFNRVEAVRVIAQAVNQFLREG